MNEAREATVVTATTDGTATAASAPSAANGIGDGLAPPTTEADAVHGVTVPVVRPTAHQAQAATATATHHPATIATRNGRTATQAATDAIATRGDLATGTVATETIETEETEATEATADAATTTTEAMHGRDGGTVETGATVMATEATAAEATEATETAADAQQHRPLAKTRSASPHPT